MPRFLRHAVLLAAGLAVTAEVAPARADKGAVIVVPSRPGVPIAINGRDASWSVVEGDIGLARPGHLTPVIIGGGRPLPPRHASRHNAYFPRYGTMPLRGRNEVEPGPDRPLPEPSESFYRSWSTSSDLSPPRQEFRHELRHEPRQDELPPARQHSQRTENETLPATIDDGQPPFAPPIVVVPHRGRRP